MRKQICGSGFAHCSRGGQQNYDKWLSVCNFLIAVLYNQHNWQIYNFYQVKMYDVDGGSERELLKGAVHSFYHQLIMLAFMSLSHFYFELVVLARVDEVKSIILR